MKKIVSSLLLVSMLMTSIAHAQETPTVTEDEFTNRSFVAPLAMGKRAPYTGLLLTPRAAAEVMTRIETFDKLKALEIQRVVDDLNARHSFEIKELTTTFKAEKDTLQAKSDRIQHQLDACESVKVPKPEDPPSRVTWSTVGFIGGIIFTGAAIFTAQSLTK